MRHVSSHHDWRPLRVHYCLCVILMLYLHQFCIVFALFSRGILRMHEAVGRLDIAGFRDIQFGRVMDHMQFVRWAQIEV